MTNDHSGYLLTPGPLTTSARVRRSLDRDWGSRDPAFIELTARVRQRLNTIAQAQETHECVPVQGSGTFAVEAMLGTFAPQDGRTLVAVNGAYGERMVAILKRLGRPHATLQTAEDQRITPEALAATLDAEPALSHVAVVHCETTTGIRNELEQLAQVVAQRGRALLIDAMSSFGALPVSAATVPFQALAASSNKCLQGVPGVGFVIAERSALEGAAGRCHSVSLDLHDQWRALEGNGQWRFTPPTQVLAALDEALDELAAEGGISARLARYQETCDVLIDGLTALGFELLLPRDWQAPIIVTFVAPTDPAWNFERFYDALQGAGFTIYPGKLTQRDSFRVGCIGDLDADVMRRFVAVCAEVVTALELRLAS